MARARQGSGSRAAEASPSATPSQESATAGVAAHSVDNLMPRATPAYAHPGPQAVDASPAPRAPAPAAAQSFAGLYVALARLNIDTGDGIKLVAPGTEVQLSDADARHFLKSKVIKAVLRNVTRKGDVAAVLHDGHDYSGQYIANNVLSRDGGTRVLPGETVDLPDDEARHFLKLHAIRSASGLEI